MKILPNPDWMNRCLTSLVRMIASHDKITGDQGRLVEDVVEQICHTAFLQDFVVRHPTFEKSRGRIKEAADFLVPFRNTLLAFQVTSKNEPKPGSKKTETDLARIAGKTAGKGIDQLATIRRAVRSNRLPALKNARNITIPFERSWVDRMIGVVIVDLLGEDKFPSEERTSIYDGYVCEDGMPIHLFRRQDFAFLLSEVDTLPEFIQYLDTRQQLFEKDILGPFTQEPDFLAT
ncbi:MAG: hypothetical protein V2A74_08665, partial [bacterium]